MSKRVIVRAVATVIGLTCVVGVAAAGSNYPSLALPDGTAVSDPTAAGAGQVAAPLTVESYNAGTSADELVVEQSSPPGNFSTTMWGYEAAATNARLLQYDIGPPVVAGPFCVPTHTAGFTTSQNGRGVAFDPLDGNLWNTHVGLGFNGDGFIHKNTPPPACAPVTSIPFGDGPGGTIQDDIGSVDVDEATKHLWVAGYKPVVVGTALLSYFYKVNRNNGKIIDSCAIPFRGGGVGNETLAVYRNTSLPGSSKYLLTDAGEPVTVPPSYALIDQADCHGGAVVTPVMEFAKTTPGGATGIDAEWPGLLVSTLPALFNHDGPPFAAFVAHGPYGNSVQVEDISLCAFRAKIGGDGNDMCPLP
jgi:hypothetical protein